MLNIPISLFFELKVKVVPILFEDKLLFAIVLPPLSKTENSPLASDNLLIILLSVVRLKPSAPGETVIAAPACHP